MRVRFVIAAVSCIAQIAIAQPQQPAGKVDAKALMQSGLKLFEAKDYLGALAVFTDAYKRFPTAKILLNIGTTEALLERKADAANSYQRYLDSPDADPAKKSDVAAQIAELDKAAGLLQLEITPDDAEVLLDDEWVSAKSVHSWRVVPGAYTIKVRKSGYQPEQKQDAIQGGAKAKVSIALVKLPEPEKQVIVVPAEDRPIIPEGPRSRIGAVVFAHVSVLPKIGSAVFIGGTADVTEQLALDATLILGPGLVNSMGTATLPPPRFGAYAGAKFAFLTGNVRPLVSAGIPIFFDDGARLFMRVAGGVEYIANRNLSFLIELGGEYGVNPRDDIRNFALVPSLGAAGRL